jgi:hypothetical protein
VPSSAKQRKSATPASIQFSMTYTQAKGVHPGIVFVRTELKDLYPPHKTHTAHLDP